MTRRGGKLQIHLSADVRRAQIRAALADGPKRVAEIARPLGCTAELVRYYARRMPDVARTAVTGTQSGVGAFVLLSLVAEVVA